EAWNEYYSKVKAEAAEIISTLNQSGEENLKGLADELQKTPDYTRKNIVSTVRQAIRLLRFENNETKDRLTEWYKKQRKINEDRYNSKLFTGGVDSPTNIPVIPAAYDSESTLKDGREILNACFD